VTHAAHVEWEAGRGWRVVCGCGWISGWMGDGDAYTVKARGLADQGHEAFDARRRTMEDAADSLTASANGVI